MRLRTYGHLQLQAYLGIPEGGQAVKGSSGGQKDEISDDEEESAEEDEDNGDEPTEISSRQEANILTESDLRSRVATSKAAAKNEQRIERFFQDPESSIRIFMSSYSRVMGFIWYLFVPEIHIVSSSQLSFQGCAKFGGYTTRGGIFYKFLTAQQCAPRD
jgi:hypothetical protein